MPSDLSNGKSQIDALTGIRILAAGYVFLYHVNIYMLKPLLPDVWTYTMVLFEGGWLGVDLFFLLSGFIISYNYYETFASEHENSNYRDFLFKRLARIYPVHLFTTVAVFLPMLFAFGANIWATNDAMRPHLDYVDLSIVELFKSLILVQGWTLPTLVSWNAVSWSVSCEWLAYLCFPIIVAVVRPLKNGKQLIGFMTFIFLLAILATAITAMLQAGNGSGVMGLIRITAEFTMGVVLYRLYRLKPVIDKPKTTRFSIMVLIASLLVVCSGWHIFAVFWTVPFYAWLILAVARGRVAPPFLSSKAFIYGGKISYSLYLCHGVCLVLVLMFFNPSTIVDADMLTKAAYILAYMSASLGLTLFCFHFVEEPSRKRLVAWWKSSGWQKAVTGNV